MLQKYDSASSKGFGVRWRISVRNLWLDAKKNMLLHHFKEYSGILYRYEKIWMQRYSEKGYVHILHTVHSAAGVLYSAKEALTRIYIYIYIYRLQLLVESVDRPARRSDQARK